MSYIVNVYMQATWHNQWQSNTVEAIRSYVYTHFIQKHNGFLVHTAENS